MLTEIKETIINNQLSAKRKELVEVAEFFGGIFHGHNSLHVTIADATAPITSIVIDLCYTLEPFVFFVVSFDANNILVNRQSPLRGKKFISAMTAYCTAFQYATQCNKNNNNTNT